MKKISLDQAEPGMVLAQKIVREDGILLAQKGTEIGEPLLRMLDRLNFETVYVEEEDRETPEEKTERLNREEADIHRRFKRVERDPVLQQLKKALIQRLKEAD